MADNQVDALVEKIEEFMERANVDGIGDNLPEGGDDVKVPLMENDEPYPAHVPPEDLETHNPDCPDTGTEDDDDPYRDWDEEGPSDCDDEEVAESDSRDRFCEFAYNSAALFNALSSILSNKDLQELSFGVSSGDLEAYFSIKTRS